MMRKYFWLVFALVFTWKIALFIFTTQPVPANDAFFYDGAVIHHLLHGGYYNPTVKLAFPISGGKIFSAYPPLYQVPLLGWMSLFGTSARAAIALHLCLFGFYLLTLLAIFRRLQIPAWCVNLAGGFLLIFTFHDRPDSFAHLLGVLAVYTSIRSRRVFDPGGSVRSGGWIWLMALLVALAFCTSLQIGGIYLLVVSLIMILAFHLDQEPIPFLPMAVMVLAPMALVCLVRLILPQAWDGFMENVRQTPFITGLRLPHTGEILKIIRTIPGILLVAVALPWTWLQPDKNPPSKLAAGQGIILLATLLPALGIVAASLLIISPNTVAISNYLQPVIVASYLAFSLSRQSTQSWRRLQNGCLLLAVLLGSVRAVGMTTWGVACAMDMGYQKSIDRVESELSNHPAGYKVIMSSAFLYGAARHDELELIHSDWTMRADGDSRKTDVEGLQMLQPEKIILTQYDYYRRFQALLELLKKKGVQVRIENTAQTPPPDSIKALQQVVQHVSWAPVIINLSWPKPTQPDI